MKRIAASLAHWGVEYQVERARSVHGALAIIVNGAGRAWERLIKDASRATKCMAKQAAEICRLDRDVLVPQAIEPCHF